MCPEKLSTSWLNNLPMFTQVIEILKKGGVAVFPTDTAYALGGDFENPEVTFRILDIKGRTDKKFTLVAANLQQVQQFFSLEPKALKLAKKYWPGPLSLVVSDRFSIRVPAHDVPRQLAASLGKPLIATSANKRGQTEVYTQAAAQQALGEHNVDAWIDGGELVSRPVSTIVRVLGNQVKVIRQGSIHL